MKDETVHQNVTSHDSISKCYTLELWHSIIYVRPSLTLITSIKSFNISNYDHVRSQTTWPNKVAQTKTIKRPPIIGDDGWLNWNPLIFGLIELWSVMNAPVELERGVVALSIMRCKFFCGVSWSFPPSPTVFDVPIPILPRWDDDRCISNIKNNVTKSSTITEITKALDPIIMLQALFK